MEQCLLQIISTSNPVLWRPQSISSGLDLAEVKKTWWGLVTSFCLSNHQSPVLSAHFSLNDYCDTLDNMLTNADTKEISETSKQKKLAATSSIHIINTYFFFCLRATTWSESKLPHQVGVSRISTPSTFHWVSDMPAETEPSHLYYSNVMSLFLTYYKPIIGNTTADLLRQRVDRCFHTPSIRSCNKKWGVCCLWVRLTVVLPFSSHTISNWFCVFAPTKTNLTWSIA